MSAPDWQALPQAYAAAVQAAAAAAIRNLFALERDDPQVRELVVTIAPDWSVSVELRTDRGMPVGGYSL